MLPSDFAELEPYSDWVLGSEHERYAGLGDQRNSQYR